MIPPFAVSFSSSLRTRTRSCRGVIFTVISLTSIQSIPKLEQVILCGSRPTLRVKNLPVLLSRRFEVVRLLFLNRGLSLRPLLLIQFHGFRDSKLSFFIDALGINDEPKAISIGGADKIEGVLRVLPRRDRLLPHHIPVILSGIDLHRSICRRAVFRRDRLHHVLCGEPFRAGSIVSHRNLVELAVVEGEKNLFYGIRLERSPRNAWRPPVYFLNQRWTAMNQLYIGHLLASALQHFGQAHSQREVPILRKILCTEQWRRKEQNNKTKN